MAADNFGSPLAPVNASGAANQRIYLDAIDEAFRRRKSSRGSRGRRPRRQLIDIAMKQLRHAERVSRMMGKRINAARILNQQPCKECGQPAPVLDEEFVDGFNKVTTTISNMMEQIRRTNKAEQEKFGGLTDDQMDEVFKQQLERIAPKLDEYDRYILLTAWFGEDVAKVILESDARSAA